MRGLESTASENGMQQQSTKPMGAPLHWSNGFCNMNIALPSITGFIVTPFVLFDTNLATPNQMRGIAQETEKLTEEKVDSILSLKKEMTNK